MLLKMQWIFYPLKTLIQETAHTLVEELVKNIFRDTPLKNFDGADFISIGINFALDLFLFRLRNLELRELDNS